MARQEIAVKHLDYAVYDAFSAVPYGGSPAALVAGAGSLRADQMQRIAKEFGAPATGFITAVDGEVVSARFFSTQTEYPMCGHGSIALATWLVDRGVVRIDRKSVNKLVLRTPGGSASLEVRVSAEGISEVMLSLPPADPHHDVAHLRDIVPLLGASYSQVAAELPLATTHVDFNHFFIPFDSLASIDNLTPDFTALANFCRANSIDTVMAFSLQTESPGNTVHCREFAPAVGTPEVAATGTTNRALACYLHACGAVEMPRNGIRTLVSEQGYAMGRPSLVRSELEFKDGLVSLVRVGGTCSQVMEGRLRVS